MSKRDESAELPPAAAELAAEEIEFIQEFDAAELRTDFEPNEVPGEPLPAPLLSTETTALDMPVVHGSEPFDTPAPVAHPPFETPPPAAPALDREPWIGTSHVEVAPEPLSAFDPPSPIAASPQSSVSSARPVSGAPVQPPRLRIALAMFVLTFVSTTAIHLMLMLQPGSLRELIDLVRSDPTMLRPALIFSLALMGILLIHDLGHSLTSLATKVQQSYPYFIPFPAVFGSLGSVVFLRSEPPHRSALLRMAAMGPVAGMVAAVPIAAYGLSQSLPLEVTEIPPGATWLGNSLLFTWLAEWFSPNGIDVQLHPLALAGWVAMFITSINLLPAAQLDGGHIAHALFGRGAVVVSILTVAGLFVYGIYLTLDTSYGAYAGVPWLLWGTLIFISGFGHPRVREPKRSLRLLDGIGAVLCLAIAVLTFVPVPVQIVPDDPSQAEFLEPDAQEDKDWGVEDSDPPPETFEL